MDDRDVLVCIVWGTIALLVKLTSLLNKIAKFRAKVPTDLIHTPGPCIYKLAACGSESLASSPLAPRGPEEGQRERPKSGYDADTPNPRPPTAVSFH